MGQRIHNYCALSIQLSAYGFFANTTLHTTIFEWSSSEHTMQLRLRSLFMQIWYAIKIQMKNRAFYATWYIDVLERMTASRIGIQRKLNILRIIFKFKNIEDGCLFCNFSIFNKQFFRQIKSIWNCETKLYRLQSWSLIN